MRSTVAIIRAVVGRQVEVEIETGGCGRCHEPGGCGGQNLSRAFCGGPKRYLIDNPLSARVGDRVHVGVEPASVRRAATRAYVVPLLATLAGAAAGSVFGSAFGVVGAAAGLGVGWYGLSACNKNDQAPPRMIGRVAPADGDA